MKSSIVLLTAAAAASSLLLASCTTPSYPSSDAKISSTSFTSYDAVTVPAVSATLSDTFMRGVDCSTVYAIEQTGAKYYDEDNTEKDPLAVMKEHGVNWVRLRIWNNPSAAATLPAGACDLARTKAVAKRAKALGMKVLLDFHYSDTWADPVHQIIPAAWTSLTTITELSSAVYDYTYDTLKSMSDAGCAPDMVQLGNEIEDGMFLTTTSAVTDSAVNCAASDVNAYLSEGTSGTYKSVTASSVTKSNLAAVLNAAASAVRLADPDAKVMLHLSRGGDQAVTTAFLDKYAAHSGTAATVASVDFDVVGLSYYPFYSSHKTLGELKTNMAYIKSAYGKDVLVAETSYGWSCTASGDDTSNTFYLDNEQTAYTELVTEGSNESDFAITETTYKNKTAKAIAATPQNQANVVRAVIQATAQEGGIGVFYWGGDWIVAKGIGDAWENQALFDIQGKCLPGMNVFNVTGTSN